MAFVRIAADGYQSPRRRPRPRLDPPECAMTRVLLIGSSGFTGRYVGEELRRTPDFEVLDGNAFAIDIRRTETFASAVDRAKPDAIINLAAVSTLSLDDIGDIYEMNGFAVVRMLEHLKRIDFVGRFVNASAAYVYGDCTPEMIREDDCLRPTNHYACAKAMADHTARLYEGELDLVVARPFNCIGIGHGTSFVVPKIISHFRDRLPTIELGAVGNKRDFVDIRDIARMYRAVLAAQSPPAAINFCSGKPVSIADIVAEMVDVTGHPIEIVTNPDFVRTQDNPLMYGDISRLKAIGFEQRYSLKDTLLWMLQGADARTSHAPAR